MVVLLFPSHSTAQVFETQTPYYSSPTRISPFFGDMGDDSNILSPRTTLNINTRQIGSLAGWRSYEKYLDKSAAFGTAFGGGFARVGPMRLSLGIGVAGIYDTNVNVSPTNPLSDFILETQLRLGVRGWITRRNSIEFSIGLDLQRYMVNEGFAQNSLFIDPNTRLDYRIFIEDFIINLYEYPSMTPVRGPEYPALTDLANFRQFNNQAGIAVMWHLNRLISVLGIERRDLLGLDGQFSALNDTTHTLYGGAFLQLSNTSSIGLRSQAGVVQQQQQVLNDSFITTTGILWQGQVSKFTSFFFEGGLQTGTFYETGKQVDEIEFDQSGGFNTNVEGTLGGGNYALPYFVMGISNRPRRFWEHNLIFQRAITASSVSNYQENNKISYYARWRINRYWTLSLDSNFNFGQISSSSGKIPYYNAATEIMLSAKVSRDLTLMLRTMPQYYYRGSDDAGPFPRNVFSISIFYGF